MIKKNKIFSLLIHLYLIILLTPDLSGRGIARDAETEIFLSEMTRQLLM